MTLQRIKALENIALVIYLASLTVYAVSGRYETLVVGSIFYLAAALILQRLRSLKDQLPSRSKSSEN